MLIGITGKSGVGKNHFIDFLYGVNDEVNHVDIDLIGHAVVDKPHIMSEIISAFGIEVLDPHTTKLNRKKIAELVFTDRDKHKVLEEITWKEMEIMIDLQVKKWYSVTILNWILLPKTKYWDMCDKTFLITRKENDRVKSILARDKITMGQLAKRDSASPDFSQFKYNFILENV